MSLQIVAGSANPHLAARVARELGVELAACDVASFPDGEIRPTVSGVRGGDVYVIQPTGRAVNQYLMELLFVLDACRRAGAERVTAVVPYFGYARQDRRTHAGESLGGRVVADLIRSAGADRLVVVDPHTAAFEAMCPIPVETLTAVPILAGALTPTLDDSVIVAPDLGAVKLAERYASELGLPVAFVRKTRISGTVVAADELVGDVRNRHAIIVDDMISTGGTVQAAAHLLAGRGARPDLVIAATHGLLVGSVARRFETIRSRRLVVTDTVTPSDQVPIETFSVATLLADAVGRLYRSEPLDELGGYR